MTTAERARIWASTWTFWASVAGLLITSVQGVLVALKPEIPFGWYLAFDALVAFGLGLAKLLSINPPPIDLAQKFREAVDQPESDDV